MKYLATVLLLLSISPAALGRYTTPANNLVDKLIADLRTASTVSNLDPALASPFKVLVKGNGFTNVQFDGNFTTGSVVGLSLIERWGNCTLGFVGKEDRIGCYLKISPVKALLNANVKGDSIFKKEHAISTITEASINDHALLEFQGSPDYAPKVVTLSVTSLTLTTKVIDGKVDLNTSRFTEFRKQVNSNVASQINYYFNGPLRQAIDKILLDYRML